MESLSSHEAPRLDGTDVLAVVLSVLAPGLGHVVVGQVAKGLVIMTLVIASCGIGYVASAFIALDTYMVARAKRVREVGDWEIFPDYRTALQL